MKRTWFYLLGILLVVSAVSALPADNLSTSLNAKIGRVYELDGKNTTGGCTWYDSKIQTFGSLSVYAGQSLPFNTTTGQIENACRIKGGSISLGQIQNDGYGANGYGGWFKFDNITNQTVDLWGFSSGTRVQVSAANSTHASITLIRGGSGVTAQINITATTDWIHLFAQASSTCTAQCSDIWVNGVRANVSSGSGWTTGSTSFYIIGQNLTNAIYIDQFIVTNNELNSTEIAELYSSGNGNRIVRNASQTNFEPLGNESLPKEMQNVFTFGFIDQTNWTRTDQYQFPTLNSVFKGKNAVVIPNRYDSNYSSFTLGNPFIGADTGNPHLFMLSRYASTTEDRNNDSGYVDGVDFNGSFSIAWSDAVIFSGNQAWFDNSGLGDYNFYIFSIGNSTIADGNSFRVQGVNSNGQIQVLAGSTAANQLTTSSNTYGLFSARPGARGTSGWYKWLITYDEPSKTINLYRDGVLIGQKVLATEIYIPSNQRLYIGSYWGSTPNFRGAIDNLAIWNRTLTQGEAVALSTAGINGKGYIDEAIDNSSLNNNVSFAFTGNYFSQQAIADISGNARNAIASTNVYVVQGQVGKAVRIDSPSSNTNPDIIIPSLTTWGDDWTVCMNVNITNQPGLAPALLSRQDGAGPADLTLYYQEINATHYKLGLDESESSGGEVVNTYGRFGQFQNLCWAYSAASGDTDMYVNGTSAGTLNHAGPHTFTTGQATRFGGYLYGDATLNQTYDEVIIWSGRKLSATEITRLQARRTANDEYPYNNAIPIVNSVSITSNATAYTASFAVGDNDGNSTTTTSYGRWTAENQDWIADNGSLTFTSCSSQGGSFAFVNDDNWSTSASIAGNCGGGKYMTLIKNFTYDSSWNNASMYAIQRPFVSASVSVFNVDPALHTLVYVYNYSSSSYVFIGKSTYGRLSGFGNSTKHDEEYPLPIPPSLVVQNQPLVLQYLIGLQSGGTEWGFGSGSSQLMDAGISWSGGGETVISNSTSINKTALDAYRGKTVKYKVDVADQDTSGRMIFASFQVNRLPNATNVSISPNGTLATDNLFGNYTYSDADGNAESGTTYRWIYTNNGTVLATSRNLTIGNISLGATVVFEVTPRDGNEFGAAVNSSNTFTRNSVPVASNVSIYQNGTRPTDYLFGNYTYTDADNDTENGTTYRWYYVSNSTVFSTARNLSIGDIANGTTIRFEVTPRDIYSTGTAVNSSNYNVSARVPPTIALVLLNASGQPVYNSSNLMAASNLNFFSTNFTHYNFSEAGAALYLTYVVNGTTTVLNQTVNVVALSNHTSTTFQLLNYLPYTYTVTAYDQFGKTSTYTGNLLAGNQQPNITAVQTYRGGVPNSCQADTTCEIRITLSEDGCTLARQSESIVLIDPDTNTLLNDTSLALTLNSGGSCQYKSDSFMPITAGDYPYFVSFTDFGGLSASASGNFSIAPATQPPPSESSSESEVSSPASAGAGAGGGGVIIETIILKQEINQSYQLVPDMQQITVRLASDYDGEFQVVNDGLLPIFVDIDVNTAETSTEIKDWLNFDGITAIRGLQINPGQGFNSNSRFIRYNIDSKRIIPVGKYKMVLDVKAGGMTKKLVIDVTVRTSVWAQFDEFWNKEVVDFGEKCISSSTANLETNVSADADTEQTCTPKTIIRVKHIAGLLILGSIGAMIAIGARTRRVRRERNI